MMFQPRVKLLFVQRYCPPNEGWRVFVDIDASEEGRTGGERKTEGARVTQKNMGEDADRVRAEFLTLGVHVGERAKHWKKIAPEVPVLSGDHDIVALNSERKKALIVEVEGASSGQPETKVYKAVGQVGAGLSGRGIASFETVFGVVVFGDPVGKHLARCKRLAELGVFGLQLKATAAEDVELFHPETFTLKSLRA